MSDRCEQPRGIPPIAVSSTTTLENKTGSWKYIRPAYHDRVAPCNAACPVGIDVEGYMQLLQLGRVREARDLLLRENPMPSVTGRVCHHPCETACNRAHFDDAVSVHAVERVLGDMALDGPPPAREPRTHAETIAVVGSGPAGLSCAYHLTRMGYAVTVYEEALEPGGMLRLGIPEYRLPRRVLDRQIAHIEARGVAIRCGTAVGLNVSWEDLRADAVFIASGAHRARSAGMENETAPGVVSGLEFLKEVNEGRRPQVGSRVVVVGGGNTAMDCARTALRLGAQVLVLYRRSRAEMPAVAQEVDEAEREGVQFEFLAAPVGARTVHGHLAGLECMRMELGPPDESGRRRPLPSDEAPFFVVADTVLTAIGESPALDFVQPEIVRTVGGITIDGLGQASGPAVFAGGDAANEPRTVADALGSGKRAAIGIDRYLRRRRGEEVPDDLAALRFGASGNVSVARWRRDDPVRREAPTNDVVQPAEINFNHFSHERRHADRFVGNSEVLERFGEVNQGLGSVEALEEAGRCFNCAVCNECELCLIFCPDVAITRRPDGRFAIDLDYCKGCGVCAVECPRGAIIMTKEGI
ncbi:MAG TPA: NAD(P)-binding protein [Gemmatimonadales bacterium]|jgi:2-oxoacid:acceptor oxidoreductase delta subunit (pyruvate/2-ketoisovalerate family)